jgi:hypothetical protein
MIAKWLQLMWRADITGISKVEMHAIYSSAPSQLGKLRL